MPPHPRFTLRDLPLPAKLVVSVFLLSVGLGYCSAIVQLHMKHSSMDGSPLPGPNDVVERFSRFRPFDGTYPKSKIEEIISGDPAGGFNKANMTPAFFGESDKAYKAVKDLPKDDPKRAKLHAEREGERQAVIAWINSPPAERKQTYDADAFALPPDLADKPITGKFNDNGKVQIQSLIGDRCGRCHDAGQLPNFGNFDQLQPLVTAPKPETFTSGGTEWVLSPKTITLDGLTQSTHAHLLSFSMLFALTGLTFAFSSYRAVVRGVLGPLVLVAQVADIACWWLARLDLPHGPMFAQCIMATGGVVGLGLGLQIVLSLLDMYGRRGKVVLATLFVLAGFAFTTVYTQAIKPGLEAEKERTDAVKGGKPENPPADQQKRDNPGRGAGGA